MTLRGSLLFASIVVAAATARADMMAPGQRIDSGFEIESAVLPPGRVLLARTQSGRCYEPVVGRTYPVAMRDPTTVYDVAVEVPRGATRGEIRAYELCRAPRRDDAYARQFAFVWSADARALFTVAGGYHMWEGETAPYRREVRLYSIVEGPRARLRAIRYECKRGRPEEGSSRGNDSYSVCGGSGDEKAAVHKVSVVMGIAALLELVRRARRASAG